MTRRLVSLCVCLLVFAAVPVFSEDDVAVRRFEALKQEFIKTRGEGRKAIVEQVLGLARKEPKSSTAVDALIWVVIYDQWDEFRPKAWDALKSTYVNDPRLGPGLELVIGSPYGMDHVQAVLKTSRNPTVKGFATLAIADWLQRNARDDATRERMLADAERLADDILKNYAEVRRGGNTLGDAAKALQDRIRRKGSIAIGKVAPDIAGEDADGKPLKLSDYSGKVVLLKFWGNWCPPCRAMIPYEVAVTKRLEKKPFTMLGVNTDQDREALKKAVKQHQITWPSFFDGNTRGPICQDWEIQGFPTLYLIDAKGVIRHKFVGSPGEKHLDQVIDGLVQEAETQAQKPEPKQASTEEKPNTKEAPATPTAGQAAPEIVGEDLEGKELKLSDYRGKVVMLEFWGHW